MTTDICVTLLRKGLDINKIYYLYHNTNETGFAEIGLNDFLKTFNYINNNNALNEEIPEDINKKEEKQKEKVNFNNIFYLYPTLFLIVLGKYL